MNEMGLRSKLSKKFRITTDSNHDYLIVENHLNRQFKQTEPSKAWVSDITYIPVKEGFLYLTTILDLHDRKLIGWSLSDGMSTDQTSLPAWRMALKNRKISKGLIFHSDRGVQYANKKFANTLESYKVKRSMSRKGTAGIMQSLKASLNHSNQSLFTVISFYRERKWRRKFSST